MKYHVLTIVLSLMFIAQAHAAPGKMQPGLWEMNMRVEIPGMPMAMPPQTLKHCYTKEDVATGTRTAPRSDDKNCTIKNYKTKGNTASWDIVCTGEEAFTGSATATMTSTTYSGTMTLKMKGEGEMTQKWTGKRIGDCKK